MNVIVRTLLNEQSKEIGVVLTANVDYIPTKEQKEALQKILEDYAHNRHYYGLPLSVYNHNEADTPAIVVFKDINSLQQTTINI